jgi:hypothetical protein
MSIFLAILGVVWLLFAVISLGNWATIIPTNIMQQIYQQNALLLSVLLASFAMVFFAGAAILNRLPKRAREVREEAPEPEIALAGVI